MVVSLVLLPVTRPLDFAIASGLIGIGGIIALRRTGITSIPILGDNAENMLKTATMIGVGTGLTMWLIMG